jgi:predicted transcriptional regulator
MASSHLQLSNNLTRPYAIGCNESSRVDQGPESHRSRHRALEVGHVAAELDPKKVLISQIMSSPLITVDPDEDLLKASQIMRNAVSDASRL